MYFMSEKSICKGRHLQGTCYFFNLAFCLSSEDPNSNIIWVPSERPLQYQLGLGEQQECVEGALSQMDWALGFIFFNSYS